MWPVPKASEGRRDRWKTLTAWQDQDLMLGQIEYYGSTLASLQVDPKSALPPASPSSLFAPRPYVPLIFTPSYPFR